MSSLILGVPGGDEIKHLFEQVLLQEYKQHILILPKHLKEGVINAVREVDSIDYVVIHYSLESTKPFSVPELARIRALKSTVRIVLILPNEFKGNVFINELYSKGLYLGIYEKDANLSNIAKLLITGRNKEEAESYYSIPTKTHISSIDKDKIIKNVKFLSNIADTQLDFATKLNHVHSMLTTEEFLCVLKNLSDDMLETIESYESYQIYFQAADLTKKRKGLFSSKKNKVSPKQRIKSIDDIPENIISDSNTQMPTIIPTKRTNTPKRNSERENDRKEEVKREHANEQAIKEIERHRPNLSIQSEKTHKEPERPENSFVPDTVRKSFEDGVREIKQIKSTSSASNTSYITKSIDKPLVEGSVTKDIESTARSNSFSNSIGVRKPLKIEPVSHTEIQQAKEAIIEEIVEESGTESVQTNRNTESSIDVTISNEPSEELSVQPDIAEHENMGLPQNQGIVHTVEPESPVINEKLSFAELFQDSKEDNVSNEEIDEEINVENNEEIEEEFNEGIKEEIKEEISISSIDDIKPAITTQDNEEDRKRSSQELKQKGLEIWATILENSDMDNLEPDLIITSDMEDVHSTYETQLMEDAEIHSPSEKDIATESLDQSYSLEENKINQCVEEPQLLETDCVDEILESTLMNPKDDSFAASETVKVEKEIIPVVNNQCIQKVVEVGEPPIQTEIIESPKEIEHPEDITCDQPEQKNLVQEEVQEELEEKNRDFVIEETVGTNESISIPPEEPKIKSDVENEPGISLSSNPTIEDTAFSSDNQANMIVNDMSYTDRLYNFTDVNSVDLYEDEINNEYSAASLFSEQQQTEEPYIDTGNAYVKTQIGKVNEMLQDVDMNIDTSIKDVVLPSIESMDISQLSLGIKTGKKVIGVCGLSQKAGNTFIALNCAKAISETGRDVGIVEIPYLTRACLYTDLGLEPMLNKPFQSVFVKGKKGEIRAVNTYMNIDFLAIEPFVALEDWQLSDTLDILTRINETIVIDLGTDLAAVNRSGLLNVVTDVVLVVDINNMEQHLDELKDFKDKISQIRLTPTVVFNNADSKECEPYYRFLEHSYNHLCIPTYNHSCQNPFVLKKPEYGKILTYLQIEQNEKKDRYMTTNTPVTVTKIGSMEIGFMGVEYGVGTTHSAIMCASVLKSDFNVCILEMNESGHFKRLYEYIYGKEAGINDKMFSSAGIDFYFRLTYTEFTAQYRQKYDCIILDFGEYPCNDMEEFIRCNKKFIVAHGVEWKRYELMKCYDSLVELDTMGDWTYLIPFMQPGSVKEVRKQCCPYNPVLAIPYRDNPYMVGEEVIQLFRKELGLPSGKKRKLFGR